MYAKTHVEDLRANKLSKEANDTTSHQAEIDPENARAHYFAAGLMNYLGVGDGGRSAIETALRMRPDDFDVLYNASCYYALAGDADRSLDLLEEAVNRGQGFLDWIEHDSDYAKVRHLPRFKEIVGRLRE